MNGRGHSAAFACMQAEWPAPSTLAVRVTFAMTDAAAMQKLLESPLTTGRARSGSKPCFGYLGGFVRVGCGSAAGCKRPRGQAAGVWAQIDGFLAGGGPCKHIYKPKMVHQVHTKKQGELALGSRLPSTSRKSGFCDSPAAAPSIAFMAACRGTVSERGVACLRCGGRASGMTAGSTYATSRQLGWRDGLVEPQLDMNASRTACVAASFTCTLRACTPSPPARC